MYKIIDKVFFQGGEDAKKLKKIGELIIYLEKNNHSYTPLFHQHFDKSKIHQSISLYFLHLPLEW